MRRVTLFAEKKFIKELKKAENAEPFDEVAFQAELKKATAARLAWNKEKLKEILRIIEKAKQKILSLGETLITPHNVFSTINAHNQIVTGLMDRIPWFCFDVFNAAFFDPKKHSKFDSSELTQDLWEKLTVIRQSEYVAITPNIVEAAFDDLIGKIEATREAADNEVLLKASNKIKGIETVESTTKKCIIS